MPIINLSKTKEQLRRKTYSGRRGPGWGPDQAVDHLNLELVRCQENDEPGKMVFCWNDGIGGYAYDEQHPIAQRIGPEMQPFVAGLSSDPDYWRNQTVVRQNEMFGSCLLCFCIGPFALI